MRGFFNLAIGLLTLAYPLAVYFGIRYLEPWTIALGLLVVLAARQALAGAAWRGGGWVFAAGAGFCAFALMRNDVVTLRFYPVVVNAALLAAFGWSLLHPPSLIERLARLREPGLPPSGVAYTRRVTQVWCAFFIVNGALAWWTAAWGSFEQWSLYNGLIAYLLMGLLFAAEYVVRINVRKRAD